MVKAKTKRYITLTAMVLVAASNISFLRDIVPGRILQYLELVSYVLLVGAYWVYNKEI